MNSWGNWWVKKYLYFVCDGSNCINYLSIFVVYVLLPQSKNWDVGIE
jgi:hypothetical protein